MFKVKATVIKIAGDESIFPCHFGYNIGDEIIFDGEKCIGRVCPSLWASLGQKIEALHSAGPRYINPGYFYPFWYSAPNIRDVSMKKYDGLGYKPTGKICDLPKYHMGNLKPKDMSAIPPLEERTVAKDVTIMCPDVRTAVILKLEAFDLSEKGFDILYFRREMTILSKILARPGIKIDSILNEYSKFEKEEIYPPLHKLVIHILVEELELIGYVEIKDGLAFATKKGEAKFAIFKSDLTKEERAALKLA
jgi:uncharacterized repeat protein (TIGR04076 family)